MRNEKWNRIAQVEEVYQGIIERQECFTLKDLAISGKDLIALGIAPGKEIGEILDAALETILDHPEYNQYGFLKQFALIEHEKRRK